MKINLDRLGDEPLDWSETLEVEPEALGGAELVRVGPVRCEGKVSAASPGFLLRGRLSYEQELSCFRCLRPVVEPVSSRLEILALVEEAKPAGDRELEEGELGVLHLEEPILDTEPLITEQLQLNVPMKPLCRPECEGLCSQCGTDLNEGPCSCEPEEDPRWAALKALKKRSET